MTPADPNIPLICPLDGTPLHLDQRQWRCEKGHSFDVAKQGYVNLLPVHHKHSRDPGDSKEMIAARRDYLNTGVYQPIADKLTELVTQHLSQEDVAILDAGCGEGYYLKQLADGLSESHAELRLNLAGLDISKWAVIAAAKRLRGATLMVASNRSIPIPDNSLDILLCCFGFYSFEEFARVLKPGGKLIVVDADSEHLIELRQVIYPEVKRSAPPALDAANALGFAHVASSQLTCRTQPIARDQIQQLLTMTPHLYRANAAGKQAAQGLTTLALTLDVSFRVLELSAV